MTRGREADQCHTSARRIGYSVKGIDGRAHRVRQSRRRTEPTVPIAKGDPNEMSAPSASATSSTSVVPEDADDAVRAVTGAAGSEVKFSLELTQDQKDIRDWVHGFAADVVRPAAARVGRAGGDAVADHPGGGEDRPVRVRRPGAVLRRPVRADAADRQRGAVLGRRRDRHVDHGHRARRRGDLRAGLAASRSASGSRAASARADDVKVAAFCASEPNAGSDVSGVRTSAQASTRPRASG